MSPWICAWQRILDWRFAWQQFGSVHKPMSSPELILKLWLKPFAWYLYHFLLSDSVVGLRSWPRHSEHTFPRHNWDFPRITEQFLCILFYLIFCHREELYQRWLGLLRSNIFVWPNLQSYLFQEYTSLNPSRVEQNYTIYLLKMAKTIHWNNKCQVQTNNKVWELVFDDSLQI